MPQLILVDDDGRELFRGDVSVRNVEILARFVHRHMATFKGIAAIKRAIDEIGRAGEFVTLPSAPPAPRTRSRRRSFPGRGR